MTMNLSGKSVWSLDTQTMTAGDYAQDVFFNVSITNPIDSQGLQFALELPDEMLALLDFVYGDSTVFNNGVYYQMATTMATMRFVEAGKGKLIYAMMNNTAITPVTYLEPQLVEIDFVIPSEDEVIAIAQEYGMELQYDSKGNAYYSFPINFMEPGQDEGETIDTSTGDVITIMRDRFNYMNADGTVDVFSDYVELVDGALNIIVDEVKVTSTSETEALTSTTEIMTEMAMGTYIYMYTYTTTTEECLVVEPSEIYMVVGDTCSLTANKSDVTYSSADNSVATVYANGNVTATGVGTTTIMVIDSEGNAYIVTVTVTAVYTYTTSKAATSTTTTTTTTVVTTSTSGDSSVNNEGPYTAWLYMSAGATSVWDADEEGATPATIIGDGSYTVSYTIQEGGGSASIELLMISTDINAYAFVEEGGDPWVDGTALLAVDSVEIVRADDTVEVIEYTGPSDGALSKENNAVDLRLNLLNTWDSDVQDITTKPEGGLVEGDTIRINFTVSGINQMGGAVTTTTTPSTT
ncbi:MAG: Ig-like domain-containing protein [Ruminococcus sp.]|nr:Ig-like domain-containing protein [Ruminococcus sp.]